MLHPEYGTRLVTSIVHSKVGEYFRDILLSNHSANLLTNKSFGKFTYQYRNESRNCVQIPIGTSCLCPSVNRHLKNVISFKNHARKFEGINILYDSSKCMQF